MKRFNAKLGFAGLVFNIGIQWGDGNLSGNLCKSIFFGTAGYWMWSTLSLSIFQTRCRGGASASGTWRIACLSLSLWVSGAGLQPFWNMISGIGTSCHPLSVDA